MSPDVPPVREGRIVFVAADGYWIAYGATQAEALAALAARAAELAAEAEAAAKAVELAAAELLKLDAERSEAREDLDRPRVAGPIAGPLPSPRLRINPATPRKKARGPPQPRR